MQNANWHGVQCHHHPRPAPASKWQRFAFVSPKPAPTQASTALKIGSDPQCKRTWRMSHKWRRWIGAGLGWTRDRRTLPARWQGKTVAATDWEGAAAAPLRLSLTLEDRNKSTRPSVLCGRWFGYLKALLWQKKGAICLKKQKLNELKINRPSGPSYLTFATSGCWERGRYYGCF